MHADGFETLAIHAGQEPDPVTGAVVPPIYQVSTYKQDGVGGLRGAALGAGHGAEGGTCRLGARAFTAWGGSCLPVPMSEPESVRDALASKPARVVWVETPTNPLLSVADISALADVAREAGALLVVDNTFASPYLQQPLPLRAHVVVHSTTQYIGGDSVVAGGALVGAAKSPGEDIARYPSPPRVAG